MFLVSNCKIIFFKLKGTVLLEEIEGHTIILVLFVYAATIFQMFYCLVVSIIYFYIYEITTYPY
jgi:hypothetical protein